MISVQYVQHELVDNQRRSGTETGTCIVAGIGTAGIRLYYVHTCMWLTCDM